MRLVEWRYDTEQNDTQHDGSVVMLSIIFAEYCVCSVSEKVMYVECHYAE
jgi:hypothetical protein